jgi:hypothetical protein
LYLVHSRKKWHWIFHSLPCGLMPSFLLSYRIFFSPFLYCKIPREFSFRCERASPTWLICVAMASFGRSLTLVNAVRRAVQLSARRGYAEAAAAANPNQMAFTFAAPSGVSPRAQIKIIRSK